MISAAIIGASGYSGYELMKLLSRRNDVSLKNVTASSCSGQRVDEVYPSLTDSIDLKYEPFDEGSFTNIDIAFVALPSGEAMKIVPQLLKNNINVIDLSGDFRLSSASTYEQFYKLKHSSPELLHTAIYGLPELFFESIATAQFVSNPGCYSTNAILALLPALRERFIDSKNIIINSLSGVSGAGRNASIEMNFCEVNENVRAYKIIDHQHVPEIESILSQATHQPVTVSFIPHLIPVNRGIYSTIIAQLVTKISINELYEVYQEFYSVAPFVRIKNEIPQLKDVIYTNNCDISLSINTKTNQLIIISVIDNLIKGAAGQAIQNMNIMFGLPQELGLR